MRIEGKEYRTIWFENNIVKIIDQTKLPHQFIIKDLKTVNDAINAIKVMEVRGAPLIGATAAYGLVLSIIDKTKPYAAVAPINGAPLTSIVLIALIASLIVFKSLIINWCGSFV